MITRVMAFCTSTTKRALLVTRHYERVLRRRSFPGVAVLCYHGVRPAELAAERMTFHRFHVSVNELNAHCRLLRQTCHPISLTQWQLSLAGGPRLPERPVLLTFDDGYRNVLHSAAPILGQYGIPAVVFVCSEPVATRQLFWWDFVARRCGEDEVGRVKRLDFQQWRERVTDAGRAFEETDPNAPLSPDEVCQLANLPDIEVGAHTAEHPILANLNRQQQFEQIQRNKQALEQWAGRPVSSFAYPNGRPGIDYTSETVEVVRQLTFDSAFTTRHGFADAARPLERSRFVMLSGVSPAELAHRLCYSWR